MKISSRVREIRKKNNISEKKLAELSGYSESYISRLENGKAENPTIKVIERIASVLGEPLKSFINDDDKFFISVINVSRKQLSKKKEFFIKIKIQE